jgi:hypothetical protein
MNAPLGSSLGRHVASEPSPDTVERFREYGWLHAEPQHFSISTADKRLTAQEFDWLRRIGNRLFGKREK